MRNVEREVRCRNSTATRWSVVMTRSIRKENPADCVEEGNNTSEIGDPPSSAETQSNGSRTEKQKRSNGLNSEKSPVAGWSEGYSEAGMRNSGEQLSAAGSCLRARESVRWCRYRRVRRINHTVVIYKATGAPSSHCATQSRAEKGEELKRY